MKYKIFMIAAIAYMASNVYAQSTESDLREELKFGVKVGANYSNVYDEQGDNFNADPKFGLATGVFLAIPIGKYLGIQPELLFSQKGFKATGTFLGSKYDFTRTTNYLDIPLLIAIKPVPNLTILAGPQYSYLMKQNDEFSGGGLSYTQEDEFKNDDIRKNTLCFLGGVDINLNRFVIGARAGWDITKNNGDGSSTTPRYKNVWYQATIGYSF